MEKKRLISERFARVSVKGWDENSWIWIAFKAYAEQYKNGSFKFYH